MRDRDSFIFIFMPCGMMGLRRAKQSRDSEGPWSWVGRKLFLD
jgi:hypothetical protein